MEAAVSPLPNDVAALKALVLAMAQRATEAEAELANARARASADQALIAHLKLRIAKLNRERFGPHSERSRRLLDQLELQLEELEASASEYDLAAEMAAARTTGVTPFERRRPVRKPFPEHLPRERVVVPASCSCPACGGPVCRSWAKCRRAGAALHNPWPQNVAVLRIGSRRSTRRRHVLADRHRQAQQCRSPGMARRCPRPRRRASGEPSRRSAPLELV